MSSGSTILPPPSLSCVFFARNFFRALNNSEEAKVHNLIISPAAARSAMTLVLMGANGRTADEIRTGLILGSAKKTVIAQQHADFLIKDCVCNDKGVSMRLATGLYVKNDQSVRADFNARAVEFFNARADGLNYMDAEGAMRHVNKWLERQTFNTVRDLLSPAVFNPDSSVILVNSLYFRSKWERRFSPARTTMDDFWINDKQRMQVYMMRQIGRFRFGKSRKLKSTILMLPFEDSNISMLLIMPDSIQGIPELEQKLETLSLNDVSMKAVEHDVDVMLPKFKVECDVDLKVPLQKLGITRLFAPGSADLSGLFAKKSPQLITEARQKLVLNVNEAGCETEANATAQVAGIKVSNPERKIFKANRPFVFAIRNKETVYFVGHFVKP